MPMSWLCNSIPRNSRDCSAEMALAIIPRTVDIGGFEVHRALPSHEKHMVGPFIFWDQMGPGQFDTGHGVDVRPHPHIGLSTVTYLFEGNVDHKDSLGNDVRIVPGDVNLMTAGKGIVHSERTGQDIRQHPSTLFGIQSWLAQPKAFEESEPAFIHVQAKHFPTFDTGLYSGKLILGEFEGYTSPIALQWETLYLELVMRKGATLKVSGTIEERALYLVSGKIEIDAKIYDKRQMLVLRPGHELLIKAKEELHLLLLGGAAMDGPRYIWWNFVSSSLDRIKSAAEDWKNHKFGLVAGDEKEYIPLPNLPFPSK